MWTAGYRGKSVKIVRAAAVGGDVDDMMIVLVTSR
jgi:hypothetical protein